MRLPLGLLLLSACHADGGVVRESSHFDPPSSSTLTDEDAAVSVVGLDDNDVCFAVDVGDPGFGDTCAETLGSDRKIALTCGFHTASIRWGDGDALEEASYLVDSPSCADATGRGATVVASPGGA